jgi:NodT family efflux transporter outer membrane factor (OMF) lipoprotein
MASPKLSALPAYTLRAALMAGALAALAGCAPDLGPRAKTIASGELAAQKSFTSDAPAAALADGWWKTYQDPQLDRLINEALAGSPDLAAAAARLAQAQAAVRQSGAARYPTIGATGRVEEARQSLNTGFPEEFKDVLPQGWNDQGNLAVSLRYQLDLFGKNRAALAAATSDVEASHADQAAARLMLSTGVAGAYAELKRLYADRAAAEDAARVREQTARFFSDRQKAGLETRGPVSQAASEAANARADIAALDGQILVIRHQLAALVGKGPDAGLDLTPPAAQTLKPVGLPANLAADLVGRRPDIAAARARVEAAAQREKMAKADFYPNIDLVASLGYQSLPLSLLTSKDSQYGNIGPALTLPIFDGGGREGAYRARRGVYSEAVANYNRTLVNAFREVADAVSNQKSAAAQLTEARLALTSSEDAYGVVQARYGAGLVRNLDVLTAEGQVLAARRRVADLEATAFNLDVALIRALGGGYGAAA